MKEKTLPNWLVILVALLVGIIVFTCSRQQSTKPIKAEIKEIKKEVAKEIETASKASETNAKAADKIVKELDVTPVPEFRAEREEIKRYLKTYNTSRAIESDTVKE